MGQHQFFNPGPGGDFSGQRGGQVPGHPHIIRQGRFTDQKIRIPGQLDKIFAEIGIAAVNHRTSSGVGHAKSNAFFIVHHRSGFNLYITQAMDIRGAIVQLHDIDNPRRQQNPFSVNRFQSPEKFVKPTPGDNGQWLLAGGFVRVLGGKQHRYQLGGMIRMQMAVKNAGQFENGGTGFQQPAHGARAGIEQQHGVAGLHQHRAGTALQRGHTGS